MKVIETSLWISRSNFARDDTCKNPGRKLYRVEDIKFREVNSQFLKMKGILYSQSGYRSRWGINVGVSGGCIYTSKLPLNFPLTSLNLTRGETAVAEELPRLLVRRRVELLEMVTAIIEL